MYKGIQLKLSNDHHIFPLNISTFGLSHRSNIQSLWMVGFLVEFFFTHVEKKNPVSSLDRKVGAKAEAIPTQN